MKATSSPPEPEPAEALKRKRRGDGLLETLDTPGLPKGYTVDAVAAHFGLNREAVRRAIKDGRLKGGMIGGRYWTTAENVREWMSRIKP